MVAVRKIKARIVELGLTQRDVAEYMGVSRQTLTDKLNGKKDFKLSEIEAICRKLEIEDKVGYFFA